MSAIEKESPLKYNTDEKLDENLYSEVLDNFLTIKFHRHEEYMQNNRVLVARITQGETCLF